MNGVEVGNRLLRKLESVLPKIIPPLDMSLKTVYISLAPKQISYVNEKEGFLTVQLQLLCYYLSESAGWDPVDFYNNDLVMVPAHTFWSADIGEKTDFEARSFKF